MKRRLFLTGPIGCGKSTAITQALGDKSTRCGGFLTRRHREPHLHFTLESPDGQYSETFLDFPDGKPRLNMDAFSQLGVSLLSGNILVLDEIGGIELLCPDFAAALMQVLQRVQSSRFVIDGLFSMIASSGQVYTQSRHSVHKSSSQLTENGGVL